MSSKVIEAVPSEDGDASSVGRKLLCDPFWRLPGDDDDDDDDIDRDVVPTIPVRVVEDKCGTEKEVPNERNASNVQQDS